MGFVSDVISGIGNAVVGVIKGVADVAGDVIKGVGNAISGVVKFVGNTVESILKDPLPTLLQIGGAMVGIPPYVTAAVITAAKGGNLEDMAKSAAISYATTSFMSDTQIGADIKNYTSNAFAGDFTDAMMEKFNLPADTAVQISRVATSSMNSALVGGINAALTGKPIADSIASGFTSGLVYASTDSYFDSLNKDPNWGFSSTALNLMKGATSTALNTIVSGKGDPSQALGNYIAYATINLGGTKLANAAKDAYKLLTTDTNAAKDAQDKYTTAKVDYDAKVTAGEKLRNEINADAAAYDKKITDEFNPFKTSYDALLATNTGAVNTFNDQKKIFDDNKWAYDNYDAKLRGEGWVGSADENGSMVYSKTSGGHYEDRQYYDEWNQPFTQKVYVPDSQTITGYDENGPVYSTSIKYDWNPPTKQSFADKANAAGVAANAAAEKANSSSTEAKTLYDNNKTMLDSIETGKTAIDKKVADLTVIRTDIEDASVVGSTAATLKAAADAYQTKYDAWAKTKDAADRSAENYTKALAEVATRDATIDALNTNAISVTSKDADGNWALSNGMTLTTQGKFMQDGAQVFTNAAGIPQKVMDFKAADGSNVDFDDNAGRLLSETDVINICERDYGFTPTEAEVNEIAGGTYNLLGNDDINDLADKKATDTYFSVVGKDPTETQLEAIRKSGKVVDSAADLAINGLDLPADYVFPDMSTAEKISRGQAYAANRAAFGNKHIFEWTNPKTGVTGKFTTESREEKNARLEKAAENAQNRINLMPANDVAGAGRGFLGGKPAGAENIYYGKKDDNVYVDTRKFDAMGNVTSGTLTLADDKTATNVRATNILGQLAATGAQGIGELMQNYANAVALATGSDMSNTTYKLGKAIEQWGSDRDGTDVATQAKNIKDAVEKAGKSGNMFDQVSIIAKAVKDNPLGFISDIGKEVVQETPGWALGAVTAGVMLSFGAGAGAVALTAAGVSAALDGLESFGSGGREAYDALKKAGVPEDVAREKAMINGAIHAAVTAPAEFIADKSLFKAYLSSVSGGVKEYAAKYGSTIATSALSEFIEAVPQNVSTQYITTGKVDIKTATAGAFYESMIGGGTVTAMVGPAAINDAAIVAKDFAGKDVSFKELMDGTRDVNLKTLDSSATIGTSSNGGSVTLGALTAVGTDIGLSDADLKTFLPSNVTDDSSVVYRSANGTAVTLGNIDAIVEKNPSLDFTTVLDSIYTIGATDFDVLFTPSVLNGTADLRIDPTFIDQLSTDSEEALQIAKSLGYTNPSQEVLNSLTGPISEADSKAKLVDFLAGVSALQDGAPISAADAQEMMKDLGLTSMSDADAISLATKIVQSVPADKPAPDPNIQLAKDAGFPDVATYTQYGGDIKAYNTANTNAANLKTATAAGFPDFDSYTKFNGDIKAYNTEQTNATNLATAKTAGFPDYASYTQFKGDVAAYTKANEDAGNIRKATDAGFPDYATFLQYNGKVADYTAAKTAETNKKTATDAGFPDFNTYTQYGGDKTSYTAAVTAAANTKLATEAGFPDFATYTQYGGNANAFNTANANAANLATAKAAGFPDYAAYTQYKGDVTAYNNAITEAANAKKATDAGFPDYATYTQYNGNKAVYTAALSDASNTALATKAGFPDFNTYTLYGGNKKAYDAALTDTANTQKATAAGFPNYAAYTQYNGDVKAYNADSAAKIAGWKDAAEQTKANTAGYTDPATYATYLTNTANTQKATTAGFPDYGTYTQFNGDLAAYNASKLTAETTKAINNAIAGIQFPAGITAADVAAQVKAALAANPNLTVADVTGSIRAYMTANPGLSAADVNTAIASATKDLATKKDIEAAIAGIKFPNGLSAADVSKQITDALKANPGLTAADVTKAITTYMTANPGVSATDVSTAINAATKDLATNASMTTALAGVTADVKAKFDALTQGQKDVVAAYTKQGVDINKAIDDAAKTTSEQITNVRTDLTKDITNVQTQFNARVDELVLQGKTYQEATQEALKELGTGVSGLQTNVADIKKQQEAEAKAKKAAEDKAKTQGGLSAAMSLIAPAAASAVSEDTPYRQIGLKTTGDAKFEGPLEQYLKMVREGDYSPKPKQQDTQQQNQQVAPVQDELSTPQPQPQEGSDYFNYGQQTDINDLLGGGKAPELPFKAGGLATPLFAGGGTTRHGRYAGGGLNLVHHSGKPRLDFRTGNAVTGPGDGQSDDIPAMLADGEFVFPADVVAALGNGSTKAGSDKLYDMMHSIRAYHRSAKPKDLPPPAKKSPLDYLKKRTARR